MLTEKGRGLFLVIVALRQGAKIIFIARASRDPRCWKAKQALPSLDWNCVQRAANHWIGPIPQ